MTQLIIPPQSSHHHPQWHLEKLQVPEHLWKGKIRSPGSLIRFTKTESVLPGGLELILSWSAIKNGENSKKLSFPEYFVFSRHAWVWPSCPSVPSPPAHSRDGLFIWVIFYLLFEIWHFFFMLSLIFFSYGGSDRCRRESGNSIGLGTASREWSQTESVTPIRGGNGIFPAPEGQTGLWGPTRRHGEGGLWPQQWKLLGSHPKFSGNWDCREHPSAWCQTSILSHLN